MEIAEQWTEHEIRFGDGEKEVIPVEDIELVEEIVAFCRQMNRGRAPKAYRSQVMRTAWEQIVPGQ